MLYIVSAMYKKYVRVKGAERLLFIVDASDPSHAVRRLLLDQDGDLDSRTIKFISEVHGNLTGAPVGELDMYPEDLQMNIEKGDLVAFYHDRFRTKCRVVSLEGDSLYLRRIGDGCHISAHVKACRKIKIKKNTTLRLTRSKFIEVANECMVKGQDGVNFYATICQMADRFGMKE